MSTEKRKRGRPVKQPPPEPIPDTAENIAKTLLKNRPKSELKQLGRQEDEAA